MDTGRTSPILCSCVDATGGRQDVVVKLRAGMENLSGSTYELFGTLLASHFDLATPEPCLVHISQDFADAARLELVDRQARIVRESVGWNYGSVALNNFRIWPVGKTVSAQQEATALNVYAFDALIQNVDRRRGNPNLGTQGDQIVLFDHECAFSFLLAIFPSPRPWEVANETYLVDHVFRSALTGLTYEGTFLTSLNSLNDETIETISASIPEDWVRANLPRIQDHLRQVRDNGMIFIEELQRTLR